MWGRSLKASRLLHTPKTITRVYFSHEPCLDRGINLGLEPGTHETWETVFRVAMYVSISSRSSSSRLRNSTPSPSPFLT